MVNYTRGKVYKIVCCVTQKQYVGSTTQSLQQRKYQHTSSYNQWLKGKTSYVTVFEVLKSGSYEIILLEETKCSSKQELLERERFYVESLSCVNKCVPGRTASEYKKQYRVKNKDEIKVKNKQYKEKNKDEIKVKNKQYKEKNRDVIKIKNKEYKEKNKKRLTTKHKCFCNGSYSVGDKTKHERTRKHQKWLQAVEDTL